MNKGQVLEDLMWKDLAGRFYKSKRFYNSAVENILFKDKHRVEREIDVFAIHHFYGKKRYAVVVECKLSDRRTKAIKQLWYAREHMRKKYPKVRTFYMYAHSYNKRRKTFIIEWITERELDKVRGG